MVSIYNNLPASALLVWEGSHWDSIQRKTMLPLHWHWGLAPLISPSCLQGAVSAATPTWQTVEWAQALPLLHGSGPVFMLNSSCPPCTHRQPCQALAPCWPDEAWYRSTAYTSHHWHPCIVWLVDICNLLSSKLVFLTNFDKFINFPIFPHFSISEILDFRTSRN